MGLFDSLKRTAENALGNAISNSTRNIISNTAKKIQSNQSSSASQSSNKPNESNTFSFQAMPKTVEELKALPEAVLDTPFKTAALSVIALCTFGEDREIGKAMLNFLKGPQPLTPTEEHFIADRYMDGRKYIGYSYFAGSSPANDYTPTVPYQITVTSNPYSYQNENYATLYIQSSGADSPRMVTLRKKGEQWFLWEQFLLSDIRTPKSADPWA